MSEEEAAVEKTGWRRSREQRHYGQLDLRPRADAGSPVETRASVDGSCRRVSAHDIMILTEDGRFRHQGAPHRIASAASPLLHLSTAFLASLTVAFLLVGVPALAQSVPHISHRVVGLHEAYVVQKGDTLRSLSSRHGIPVAVLARDNRLAPAAHLKVGQTLRIDDRHIVPAELDDGILINVPQLMLFFFKNGTFKAAYPAALGKPTWQTPHGPFEVVELRRHPVWRVPRSIQREMAMQGKVVKTVVRPGPNNPLGDYFIALSLGNLGVHATNAPLTIYGFRTHGCIRLHPDDARELFDQVEPGQAGEIIYEPALLARLDDGRVFLEVHADIYGLAFGGTEFIRSLADSNGLSDLINWDAVLDVVHAREGIARDVTRRGGVSGTMGK
ncbi:MAG: L,D-transpeptidase family protein [Candidatus Binataceae bacterium]